MFEGDVGKILRRESVGFRDLGQRCRRTEAIDAEGVAAISYILGPP